MAVAVDWDAVRATVEAVVQENGTDALFDLRGGGTFTIKATTGYLNSQDITAGLQQRGFRIRVLTTEWDVASPGRPPEKGDLVTIWGRQHGIDAVHHRGVADVSLMYVLTILG